MDLCPENGLIECNDYVVIKLPSFVNTSKWQLQLHMVKDDQAGKCKIHTSTKVVTVSVPRIFHNAGVCVIHDKYFFPLKFVRKTFREKSFQFPVLYSVSQTNLNGFVLIYLSDAKWKRT